MWRCKWYECTRGGRRRGAGSTSAGAGTKIGGTRDVSAGACAGVGDVEVRVVGVVDVVWVVRVGDLEVQVARIGEVWVRWYRCRCRWELLGCEE